MNFAGFFLSTLLLFSIFQSNAVQAILNGNPAGQEVADYQVSVQDFRGHNICGGGLLTPQIAITAAHCVTDREGKILRMKLQVFTGATDLTSPQGVTRRVDKIFISKHFERKETSGRSYHKANIALLRLKHPASNAARFLYVDESPPTVDVPQPQQGLVAGYGATRVELVRDRDTGEEYWRGDSNTQLRSMRQTTLRDRTCQRTYGLGAHDHAVFCAQVPPYGLRVPKGVCMGDHGSPLVIRDREILGIHSNGPEDCNELYTPSLYTRVEPYRSLIRHALQNSAGEHHRVYKYDKGSDRYYDTRPLDR
ncbi:serine protease ami-like [Trichogramma pretiosum]|uniref:serine protease ami-like n=1 Tax=Trichogramma pretiosum TaxID=7493 RepID=UPI000C71B86A|nr:serine protease ami-like [Trichogramma pretiosum]